MKTRVFSLLAWPERHPGATILAIGAVFVMLYGASLVLLPKASGRIVLGDATHHYVQLRSAVFDRDLHFRNEYVALYDLRGGEPGVEWVYEETPTGHVRNLMPVGPAILWAPAFLLVALGVWVSHWFGAAYPLDGYGRLFQAAAGFSGIFAATAGSWLAYRAAAALFDRRVAIWATLAVWLSSSAIYYSLISPTYSHAASMLATGGFWLVWIRTSGDVRVRRYFFLGLLAGIAALMRWQDAVLLVIPGLELVWRRREETVRSAAAKLAAAGAGALVGFAPQAFVWWVLYGAPFTIPQGAGFMRWEYPALLAVLFSDNHGLVSWTPIAALSLIGLIFLLRRDPRVGAAALLFFIASWYVNASAADWWAGEAFGARRFVSCVPVFVLGLAALLDRGKRPSAVGASVCVAFTVHTFLLLVQYQAFMRGLRHVVPYPSGVEGLYFARFVAPFDLLRWWLSS